MSDKYDRLKIHCEDTVKHSKSSSLREEHAVVLELLAQLDKANKVIDKLKIILNEELESSKKILHNYHGNFMDKERSEVLILYIEKFLKSFESEE